MTHKNLILSFVHMIHVNYHVTVMFAMHNCVRGYNVYKDKWTARIEVLSCAREHGNREDPYAVAIKKTLGLLATCLEPSLYKFY